MPATDEAKVTRKTVVIAGNYREFAGWCREQGVHVRSPQVIYAASSDSLRGYSDVKVERVGSWADRDDLHEIEEVLRIVNRFG